MLEYESTITDAAEPHIRLYLRSKTYGRDRMITFVVGCISGAAGVAIINWLSDTALPYWVMLLAALLVGILSFFNHAGTMKTRILKSMEREHGALFPMNSLYTIKDGRLIATTDVTEVSFSLDALSEVTEDSKRLELVFGDRGICVIPLRAFSTNEQKTEFLDKIQSEQVAASDR